MFLIENYKVKITPEILLIEVFKRLWEEDTTETKDIALKNFAYIEFLLSPKKTNPFYGYEAKIRPSKILEGIGLTEEELSPNITPAIRFYKDYLMNASPTLAYYESSLSAANKVKDFLSTVDLNRVTKTGQPIYKPKDITSAISDTDKVINTLNNLKAKVEQEVVTTGRVRADRDINPFEE